MGPRRVGPVRIRRGPRLGRGVRIVARLAALAGTPTPSGPRPAGRRALRARSEEEPPHARTLVCIREGVFCCGYFCIWWVLRLLA